MSFLHGSKVLITGGHFVQNNNTSAGMNTFQIAFENLQARVVVAAFHQSSHQVDVPRCFPKTRETVIGKINGWIQAGVSRTERILWLNGAAGAGKTSIAQSIAELCAANNVDVAAFFFFRADPTRNTLRPLVATLAFQLIQTLPPILEPMVQAINSNPLIFEQSLDTQFKKLIVDPLRQIREQSLSDAEVVLIIDGVDECEGETNQTYLISTLAGLISSHDARIIVLFSSRAESQLVQAFSTRKVSDILKSLPLDNEYLPDQDIRIFVEASFKEIRDTHPLRHLLDDTWPPPQLIQSIVTKSSGQFIFAAVVMRFISSSHRDPAAQALILDGLVPAGGATPFAQLDALYERIFSQTLEPERVAAILAYSILGHETHMGTITLYLGLTMMEAAVALSDIRSLVTCGEGHLRFLHASLPDFLLDPSRSGPYSIDPAEWGARLAMLGFKKASLGQIDSVEEKALVHFIGRSKCTNELRDAIHAYKPAQRIRTMHDFYFAEFLTAIQNLDFGDNGELYRHQLFIITKFVMSFHPSQVYQIEEMHDISRIVKAGK